MPTLNESVRYEADDRPPPLLTAGLGLQYAILSLATVVLVALLFIFGVKILICDGLNYRTGIIVGVGFWVGVAVQFDLIFPQRIDGPWGQLLSQGMTAGGLTVILLRGILDLTSARPGRLRTNLSTTTLGEIDHFLSDAARRMKCDAAMTHRLRAVGEETVHTLLSIGANDPVRRLLIVARADGRAVNLEFIASGGDFNLEDQLAMLDSAGQGWPSEAEMPLRLLRHYATTVRHQQFHDTDIVTTRLEPEGSAVGNTA